MVATGANVEEPLPDENGLAYQIATQFQMGIDIKQELLEMRSESRRLSKITELLEASAAAIRKQVVERKASTNGKVDRLGPLGGS